MVVITYVFFPSLPCEREQVLTKADWVLGLGPMEKLAGLPAFLVRIVYVIVLFFWARRVCGHCDICPGGGYAGLLPRVCFGLIARWGLLYPLPRCTLDGLSVMPRPRDGTTGHRHNLEVCSVALAISTTTCILP